jgi:type IV fimbrial biogenesis protein FimT
MSAPRPRALVAPSPHPLGHAHAARGFTLVELLVTVSLVAIMLAFAAPSFTAFQRNAALRSTAANFMSAVTSARAEAMRRGINVYLIPTTDQDWSKGWTVYADQNWTQALEPSSDAIISQSPAIDPLVTVVSSTQATQFNDGGNRYLMFNGGGYPRSNAGTPTNGAIEFSVEGSSDTRRRVLVTGAGRIRLCDPAKDSSSECSQ